MPPTGGGVSQSQSTTDDNGIARTTPNLKQKAGTNVFKAAAGSTAQTNFGLTGTSGAPTKLGFATPPQDGVLGMPLFQIDVEVRDQYDNASNANVPIAVSLAPNPLGAQLSGTFTQYSASGTATFPDLMLSTWGSGFALVFSAPGLASVVSAPFSVVQVGASAVTRIQVVSDNAAIGYVGTQLNTPLVVRLVGASGAPIALVAVHWTLPPGSSVETPDAVSDSTGVVGTRVNLAPPSECRPFSPTSTGSAPP